MSATAAPEVDRPAPPSRAAAPEWARRSIAERLRVIRELRYLIAQEAEHLASTAAAVAHRPIAEKLVSEVLPLAEACRWLERNAARNLAPRRHGARGRPSWLFGVTFEIQRRPFGRVLIIGPGNYPLFLPAVQTLQALAAGNTVRLKPAPQTRAVALAFARLLSAAGLPAGLLEILEDSAEAAQEAIAEGADKVIFTGSSANGRDVLAALAKTNTPAVMELSGEDAVIVLPDADVELVLKALRFGTSLNAGETCIAPRRLIVVEPVSEPLLAQLEAAGFAGLRLERVRHEEAAVLAANASAFGLGCSIFTRDVSRARRLAVQIRTGFVLINDVIVPTADPRMPFGGVKASGYGTTRGAEGLLEMTFPSVVAIRGGRFRPHFDEPAPADAGFFCSWLRATHGRNRFSALPDFLRALVRKASPKS